MLTGCYASQPFELGVPEAWIPSSRLPPYAQHAWT